MDKYIERNELFMEDNYVLIENHQKELIAELGNLNVTTCESIVELFNKWKSTHHLTVSITEIDQDTHKVCIYIGIYRKLSEEECALMKQKRIDESIQKQKQRDLTILKQLISKYGVPRDA